MLVMSKTGVPLLSMNKKIFKTVSSVANQEVSLFEEIISEFKTRTFEKMLARLDS